MVSYFPRIDIDGKKCWASPSGPKKYGKRRPFHEKGVSTTFKVQDLIL